MTTRGQKKTSEVVPPNLSESGAVIEMLTQDTIEPATTQVSTNSKTVPALAKDVSKDKGKETDDSPILNLESMKHTSPAKAKDG